MPSPSTYDYVIVGAGSAGCVLANRLTADPDVSVLLLEAGGRNNGVLQQMPMGFTTYSKHPAFNWMYESEPEPFADNRRLFLPRGKTLGGSSSINGMLYVRGHPTDYDQWRQMGCDGWSYADVLPYFKRSEASWRGETKYRGGSGELTVSLATGPNLLYEPLEASAQAAGHAVTEDHWGAQPEGVARVEITVGKGRRANTNHAFLAPVRRRPNLTVETRALTSRVVVERGRAVAVEYRQDGQTRTAWAEREIILAGGSYNSPQLLLLSGIGPADELRELGIAPVHDLPGVGRNLHEHPLCFVNFFLTNDRPFMRNLRLDVATRWVAQWALFGTGLYATGACAGLVFLRTRPELERPDIELICSAARMDARLWFPGFRAMQEPRCDVGISLLHPDARGWVRLRSADPVDPPRIQLNLFKEKADIDSMIGGIKAARAIYNSGPLAKLVTGEADPGAGVTSYDELAAFVRRTSRITHHPTGTCTMGIGPMAVVDPQLRVRGIEGLRVADASVMPTVPGGNTNAPTIMVAEKAADMIRGRPPLPRAEL